jgi:hypothetical protein
MKTLLFVQYAKEWEHMARIGARNYWEYSSRHEYDLITLRMSMEEASHTGTKRLIQLMGLYDVIMTFGIDVLFANMDKKLEDLLIPEDNIILAREPRSWPSLFNFGVMIVKSTPKSICLLETVEKNKDIWRNYRLGSQDWLNKNFNDPIVGGTIRLVPTRAMNSTYRKGIEDWQPGDWIVHFYGRQHELKVPLMQEFIQAHPEIERP